MIEALDAIYLVPITPRSAYYDKKSVESATGEPKPKYKVCGEIPPAGDCRAFFVTTGASTRSEYTVVVDKAEWLNRAAGRLEGKSFISPKRIEILAAKVIADKTKDSGNGFSQVAIMPSRKYKQLISLFERFRRSAGTSIGESVRDRLNIAIGFDPAAALKRLGL